MTINKIQENEKIIFVLEGRMDTTTASQLENVLIPAFEEAKQIELDFSRLVYVSSAGLRVLLTGQKTAMSKESAMTLISVSEDIKEIFKISGFDSILKII